MRKYKIIKIKDPFSVDLYAVAEVSPDGKPRRILFKDVYLSVCKEYLKKMKKGEKK